MPRRTTEHITGDKAVIEVSRLLVKAGWAVEKIAADYGEDLMIQTHYKGEIDPFKIYIQVKGTDNINIYKLKNGTISYPIEASHLTKWNSFTETFLIVIWDVTQNKGYWLQHLNTGASKSKIIKIHFEPEQIFNQEVANNISALARYKYYETEISKLSMYEQTEAFINEEFECSFNDLLNEFLEKFNIYSNNTFNSEYLELYEFFLETLQNDDDISKEDLNLKAVIVSFMKYMSDLWDEIGLSSFFIKIISIVIYENINFSNSKLKLSNNFSYIDVERKTKKFNKAFLEL